MSTPIERVRAQLVHATGRRMLAVSLDVADVEALLAIAEQPALSFTALWEEGPDGDLNYDLGGSLPSTEPQ